MSSTMKDYWKFYKLSLFTSLLFIFACAKTFGPEKEQTYTGEALGTSYQVKFFHSEKLDITPSLDSIFEVINTSMSTYQSDSDISRINSGDTTVFIDEHFRKVFLASKKIYEESGGMFDPTVGKLVNAYGFGPEGPQKVFKDGELDSLMLYVGFDKLRLTDEGRIIKDHPEVFIDFNAIAKGYAVDEIARYLDNKNIENYLIEVGGELVAKGYNISRDQMWVVGIDSPEQVDGERKLQAAVKLENRAMASSGNYRKFRTDPETGQSYVHTINPLTGVAQKNDLLSASVLAENCTLADGYATAFMALGYDGSLEMLKSLSNVDVYFIYIDGNEGVGIYTSPGFEENLLEEE